MTKRSGITKYQYTKRFLDIINVTPSEINITEYIRFLWQNTRPHDGGLCLTDEGFTFLTTRLDLEYHDLNITADDDFGIGKTILDLDKYIPCPYFLLRISHKALNITVFDSNVAMMLGICGGNLDLYTDMQKREEDNLDK